MRKGRLASLAVTVGLLASLLVGAPVSATPRGDVWRARAEAAIAAFDALDAAGQVPTLGSANAYAYMVSAVGRLYGWTDPRLPGYLAKLYALRNPDGGWGLNAPYDALNNGTVNPADTTYTVTLAGHVGPPLLEAYQHGLSVPLADLTTIVSLLMSGPQIPYATSGKCLAYSRHPNDTISYGCVHNANAGAARFLTDALAAGISVSGQSKLSVELVRREAYSYLPGPVVIYGVTYWSWWRYMDTTGAQTPGHNAYSTESMYYLTPPLGYEAALHLMSTDFNDDGGAHLALPALAARPGVMDPVETTTTIWCVLSDQWDAEQDAHLADRLAAGDARALARIAYYSSANALAC